MDFSLSEEQQALKAMVADFVRKEVAEGAEKRDREAVFHKDLFARVAALGIPSIPHDVANGGVGLGWRWRWRKSPGSISRWLSPPWSMPPVA